MRWGHKTLRAYAIGGRLMLSQNRLNALFLPQSLLARRDGDVGLARSTGPPAQAERAGESDSGKCDNSHDEQGQRMCHVKHPTSCVAPSPARIGSALALDTWGRALACSSVPAGMDRTTKLHRPAVHWPRA